jgi:spore germination cell wall hydrolase CwlJ-like protein
MSHVLPPATEPQPRDFALYRPRPQVQTAAAPQDRKHRGRNLLVLLAALAVPALAAPSDWRPFDIGNAGSAQLTIEPMPFERAGDSFPGSAFYYLATAEDLAREKQAGFLADTSSAIADAIGGPIARAMRMDFSGVDRSRAVECLTAAVYYEARSESDQGQRSVAQVVLNRVAHPSYPNTVCGVIYQGSERITGCQFSFTCDGSLARRPNPMFWERARSVAAAALAGYVEPTVGLATHYHTIAIHPYWAPSLNHIVTVGAHRFYSFRGKAGSAGTFRFANAGGEPMAAPHARNPAADKAPDPVLDPLALQRAYDAGLASVQNSGSIKVGDVGSAPARPAPAPVYAPEVQSRGGDAQYRGDKLPGGSNPAAAGSVRPEYQDSGRWLRQPGQ